MSFEILDRAAAGRLGRFATPHGKVATPNLMPVVNPNLSRITPRRMRELFGTEIVITNSYVFHKHESLREAALSRGIHAALGWDGPVMTDSGTFQMYVYGDVEVGPTEIVDFQSRMGVDVATCLDLFVTPDMDRAQAEHAVGETILRTQAAVAHKGKSLLNATVQGGVHLDLRAACAQAYRDLDVDYHTIGGVVPVMERQMYPQLVEMILWSQQNLRKDRPLHLFGAGHPLVFPLAAALGCDLFDSSSYAKYAKDGRMMFPEGTWHLSELVELPCACPPCSRHGADGLKALPAAERELALQEHNLHVSFADMRRIRVAIAEGSLWELVEQRAACHPMLAAATKKLGDPVYQRWLEQREPVSGRRALRYTGSLTHNRPIFRRIRDRLQQRVQPLADPVDVEADSAWAKAGDRKVELGMHKDREKPYREHLGTLDPESDHAVISALGPVPVGLDEAYPFAQSVLPRLDGLDRGHMGWVGDAKDEYLAAHGFIPAIPGPGGRHGKVDPLLWQLIRTADWQFGVGAGAALCGLQGLAGAALVEAAGALVSSGRLRIEVSKATGKVRTIHLDGRHVLSLRAHDGYWTLKPDGARLLHAAFPAPRNRVVVAADSVPFNREGKSVFAQFVRAVDPDLRPYDECLVVTEGDGLVAVGQLLLAPDEAADFRKGMAVKVREGVPADLA
ncbi:MAG TPA: tRNA guanosine(15) transglycosylase TgtA [Candidatus Thermoplasmatota archaeon]|nr:tRNA guanosine(15) transglycosylase TgtA [Candidatus Thermoplasmatota archaeon]